MPAKTKTCKAMVFPKATTNDAILKAAKAEWKKRYILPNGEAKPNRWAPIYITRDTDKLSVRLDGDKLILSGEIGSIAAFKKTVTYK